MFIQVKGLYDEKLIRPVQLISNLFFEETVLTDEEKEMVMTFSINESKAAVSLAADGNRFESSRNIEELPEEEKERRKVLKNAVSHVVLDVLTQFTGIKQNWGVLTGIRPTKLMHKHHQENTDKIKTRDYLKETYMISDEKITLMERIVERQLAMVPDLYNLRREVSIYIGIPFCPTKCAYCTFPAFAIQGKQGRVSSFLSGLHYEMEKIGDWLKHNDMKITTVYYGGGTPTSITAQEMDDLYEHMYNVFPDVKNIREITVEAGRPDTITPDKLDVLNKWKIDRISINPQSYTQETLHAIGRHHTVEETIDKFHLARSMGMNNINMDLIIGLPGEGTDEFQHTLDETEKLMPESLTVHTLSFKRASEMTQNRDKYKVADRNEAEKMMEMAENWTGKHGYVPYYLYRQKNIVGNLENVGYAIPGQESIYNIMIMEEMQTIIGIGCGAASKFIDPETGKIEQFANPKDPKSYNERFVEYTDKKIEKLNKLFSIEYTTR
ncbi:coproporphyrinogen III oxidase [Domibacillus epiphyticus]|uniref:Coproporphyrinogen III oxidase n=1 Tax=Domibacillus epiphyticus TaxID=1714355 RepID=A0A1V2A8F3_9BACI|nr:coproporphyrinogen III oxidase [Domibacillus epiphyticus]OMP67142.1 coproporphyrinogen III oxidase [Domibacillus epiphyticus]